MKKQTKDILTVIAFLLVCLFIVPGFEWMLIAGVGCIILMLIAWIFITGMLLTIIKSANEIVSNLCKAVGVNRDEKEEKVEEKNEEDNLMGMGGL